MPLQPIPAIIHQIWSDKIKKIPGSLLKLADTWKHHHPEWKYEFWDDDSISNFVRTRYPQYWERYSAFPYDIQRWDTVRYLILYTFGGLYVDFDMECMEPIEPLLGIDVCSFSLEPVENLLPDSPRPYLSNTFIACKPGDPFLHFIIGHIFSAHINESTDREKDPSLTVLGTTGPLCISRLYALYPDKEKINLISSHYLSPFSMYEARQLVSGDYTPEFERQLDVKLQDAYAIHYFLGTWLDSLKNKRRKKKILFCIDTLLGGGAEKVLITLLRMLDPEKYEISLFVLYDQGIYFEAIPPYVTWFTPSKQPDKLSETFDIEIAFLEGMATRYVALRKSDACKIGWVHSDLYTYHWIKDYFKGYEDESHCFSQMNKLIFVSQMAKENFQKFYPQVKIDSKVIYNPLDKEEIRHKANALTIEKNKFTICCVGSLVPVKGYDRLLTVAARLREDGLDFHIWILGEGVMREELETSIHQLKLETVVELKGFQKNPYPFMQTADLFLSASHSEGYSMVICEALCLHRPILATRVGGTPEIVGDGKYGMLVDSEEEAIYNGLKRMITEPTFLKEYGEKAKQGGMLIEEDKPLREIEELLETY